MANEQQTTNQQHLAPMSTSFKVVACTEEGRAFPSKNLEDLKPWLSAGATKKAILTVQFAGCCLFFCRIEFQVSKFSVSIKTLLFVVCTQRRPSSNLLIL
jgi:hypothetical protein